MGTIDTGNTGVDRNGTLYGWSLALAAIVMLIGMSYHPSINSRDIMGIMRELAAEARFNTALHSTVMTAQVVLVFGLCGLSRQLGFGRPVVQAAFIAYCVGALAWISAGISAGFVSPSLATGYAAGTPDQVEAVRAVLRTTGAYNQGWARVAAVGMSSGIFLWSIALVRTDGARKVAGAFGLLVGAAIALGVVTGLWPLSVGGALGIALLWTAWSLSIAVLLIRNRV